MLPPGTFIIEVEDRDPDSYYQIQAGQTFIFPFTVPLFSSIHIGALHTMESAQDWSMSCWVSEKPLDCLQFQFDDMWNEHKMGRILREYEIWDQLVLGEGDARKGLEAGKTYYFNVRNLQNRYNQFKLMFSA